MSDEQLLERSQRVRLPLEQTFELFADARNLEAITPGWLRFRIVTPDEIEIGAGALIEYRLRLHGVPVRWRTRIEVWDPPHRFVDAQVSGPYALWHHTHEFEPDGDGDRDPRPGPLPDRVRAARRPLLRLFVRRDLDRIFDHRRVAIERLLRSSEPAA